MNEYKRLIEELRHRLPDYWEATRGPLPASKQVSCPDKSQHANGDRNPSAHFHDDNNKPHIWCYGCDRGFDVFDLYALDNGLDVKSKEGFKQAVTGLAQMLGLELPGQTDRPPVKKTGATVATEPTPEPARDQKADDYLARCFALRSDPTFVSYVTGRGISTETAAALGMGFDPEHYFPSQHSRQPAVVFPSAGGWCARSIEGKYHDNARNASPIWGLEELYPSEPVHATFVVEGQFDRASIVEAGFHALALGGVQNTTRLVEAVKRKTPTTGLVVLFDNESDVVTARKVDQSREKLTAALRAAGAFVFDKIGEDPLGAHDANDALRADRETFVSRLKAIDAAASEAYVLRDESKEEPTSGDDPFAGYVISLDEFPEPIPEEENPRAIFRNDYLRKGQVLTIFSVSGVGKSVISNQCTVCWARGVQDVIGLQPIRPLRVFVIQYEDDEVEMGRFKTDYRIGYTNQGWSPTEIDESFKAVKHLEVRKYRTQRGVDLIDDALVDHIRRTQRVNHYDVIVINPLSHAMCDYDISDNRDANEFLRHRLEPVMMDPETEFALVLVHHTNKASNPEQRKSKASAGAFAQYDAAGSAALMNWTRASLMIWPTSERTAFELVGAKRWLQLGWMDGEGKPTSKKYISYSSGIKFWVPTPDEIVAKLEEGADSKAPKAASDPKQDADLVARRLREIAAPVSATNAREFAKKLLTSARGNAAFDLIRRNPSLYQVNYRKEGKSEYYGGPVEFDFSRPVEAPTAAPGDSYEY